MLITTRRGKSFESPHTDESALAYLMLGTMKGSFAASLRQQHQRKGKLSEEQMKYVHLLVCEDLAGKAPTKGYAQPGIAGHIVLDPPPRELLAYPNTLGWLLGCSVAPRLLGSKANALRVRLCNTTVHLDFARNRVYISKEFNAGKYRVKGITLGYIDAGDETGTVQYGWRELRPRFDTVLSELAELEANAQETVARHGKLMGRCSFCSLPLTDPRSVQVGYGQVCASHFHLPWGEAA